ncbi:hypothetical protein ANCCEY_08572 [Ancylostoma ceylanicum]|uniref:Uncharacterized protein n=2 Tax=Ancylostoma ceylanicum TaxID=53326 RepID=A0A0D6LJV5_9BILA|nr:hypothetical protein ANCCEY_08572 [Ancylostoma ceylanicum]EYC12084.1 hypothetical protein Y032_0048g1604 [Ancylostoma ceylanicum]
MFKFAALLVLLAVQLAFAAGPLDLGALLGGLPGVGDLTKTLGGLTGGLPVVGGIVGSNGNSTVAGLAAVAPVLGLVQAVLALVIALLSTLLGGTPLGGLTALLNLGNVTAGVTGG